MLRATIETIAAGPGHSSGLITLISSPTPTYARVGMVIASAGGRIASRALRLKHFRLVEVDAEDRPNGIYVERPALTARNAPPQIYFSLADEFPADQLGLVGSTRRRFRFFVTVDDVGGLPGSIAMTVTEEAPDAVQIMKALQGGGWQSRDQTGVPAIHM